MNHIRTALKNRAAAHKAMAFAALRADSSASVRLGRYRKHIARSRHLLALAGLVGGCRMSATLARIAYDHGDSLMSVGFALETITDLLGCDGSEHNLTTEHLNGLANAVRVIGVYIAAAGLELCEHSEALGKGGDV